MDRKRKLEKNVYVKKQALKKNSYDKNHLTFDDESRLINNLNKTSRRNKNITKDTNDKKAVWEDDEDEKINTGLALKYQRRQLPDGGINEKSSKYSDLLKHKYRSVVGTPKWAVTDQKLDCSDSDEEILKTCGHLSEDKSLSKGVLQYKKLKDLNNATYNEGPAITSILFHPTANAALVAGMSGVASIFVVDGKLNSKLHSVALNRYPIHCARITNDCQEVLFGSCHKYMYSYNLETAAATRVPLPQSMTNSKHFVLSRESNTMAVAGRFGQVHILETSSKESIIDLKHDSDTTALAFSNDGLKLFGHGTMGTITVWDMRTHRISHKFYDDGCVQGASIALSPCGRRIATGSYQGAANIYNMDDVWLTDSPKPEKIVLNLTTAVTSLEFNSTSEILSIASSLNENSIKMLHLSSGTIFHNFPDLKLRITPVSTAFSPSSGYFAMGNNKSVVSLYRLKHYNNY